MKYKVGDRVSWRAHDDHGRNLNMVLRGTITFLPKSVDTWEVRKGSKIDEYIARVDGDYSEEIYKKLDHPRYKQLLEDVIWDESHIIEQVLEDDLFTI